MQDGDPNLHIQQQLILKRATNEQGVLGFTDEVTQFYGTLFKQGNRQTEDADQSKVEVAPFNGT